LFKVSFLSYATKQIAPLDCYKVAGLTYHTPRRPSRLSGGLGTIQRGFESAGLARGLSLKEGRQAITQADMVFSRLPLIGGWKQSCRVNLGRVR
jgi:hypothetical protein